jgi:hypothetical protein
LTCHMRSKVEISICGISFVLKASRFGAFWILDFCRFFVGAVGWVQGLVFAKWATLPLESYSKPWIFDFQLGILYLHFKYCLPVLMFEHRMLHLLGRYTATWPTSPALFFVRVSNSEIGSHDYLPRLALSHDPPDLCFMSS